MFVEWMGLKLNLKGTREKVAYEKKHGSPLKEVFKLMSMLDVVEKLDTHEDVDFDKLEIPSLEFMANLIHASAQKLNNGTTMEVVFDLMDIYLEEHSIFDLVAVVVEVLVHANYLNFEEQQ